MTKTKNKSQDLSEQRGKALFPLTQLLLQSMWKKY